MHKPKAMELNLGSNRGQLGAIIWPVYVGVASGHSTNGTVELTEPYDEPNYARGQINWTRRDGVILGAARVWVPKGVWTHCVWCRGPQRDMVTSVKQIPQPLVFDIPGCVDLDPISADDAMGVHL